MTYARGLLIIGASWRAFRVNLSVSTAYFPIICLLSSPTIIGGVSFRLSKKPVFYNYNPTARGKSIMRIPLVDAADEYNTFIPTLLYTPWLARLEQWLSFDRDMWIGFYVGCLSWQTAA